MIQFDLSIYSPFSLASAALAIAREGQGAEIYAKWRKLLKEFDTLRGRIDPIADQNANLDILLRSFEDGIPAYLEEHGNFSRDTAGLQLHIHLSRLWTFGAYEFLRTLHQHLKGKTSDFPFLNKTGNKGCGEVTCVVCSIGHLKNDIAVVRIGLAKGEQAADIMNPPPTSAFKSDLLAAADDEPPPISRFLAEGEGMISGVMCWHKFDKRVGTHRTITRRYLSDRILTWTLQDG